MTRAVSVRLDEDTQQALRTLESTGLSRSEAIRSSILGGAAALRRNDALRAEIAALEADPGDRAELLEVAALMDSLHAKR